MTAHGSSALAALAMIAGFSLPLGVQAGDPSSSLVPDESSPFYGSVSVGYDSSYLYRGGRFGDDAPWGEVDLNVDLSENLTLNFGTWYINPTGNGIVGDELDFYGYLCRTFDSAWIGSWEVAAGGSWAGYLEDDCDETELGLTITKSLGDWCDLLFEYVYDLTFSAQYFGYSAEKCITVRDHLDLNLGAGVSHGNDRYNYDVLGGDNIWLRVGTTIHLSETVELGAYLLENWPVGDLADAGEESGLYGGGSLTVSF